MQMLKIWFYLRFKNTAAPDSSVLELSLLYSKIISGWIYCRWESVVHWCTKIQQYLPCIRWATAAFAEPQPN